MLSCILNYYIKVIQMFGAGGGASTREPLMNLVHHNSPAASEQLSDLGATAVNLFIQPRIYVEKCLHTFQR